MFKVDRSLASLEGASLDDLMELHVSRAQVRVAPDGNPLQLCEAFICSFLKNGLVSVYIVLRLAESAKTLFYVPDKQQTTVAEGAKNLDEAVSFLSSYGFSMERTSPDRRKEAALAIPGLSASNMAAAAVPKHVPPPLEISDPTLHFRLEPTVDLIEIVSVEEVVSISRSVSPVALPVKGLSPQQSEAYICTVAAEALGNEVYVAFRLVESKKVAFFVTQQSQESPADIDRNRRQATQFLEGLGFRLEEINTNLSPAMREVVVKNVPILKKVTNRTRGALKREPVQGGFPASLQDPFGMPLQSSQEQFSSFASDAEPALPSMGGLSNDLPVGDFSGSGRHLSFTIQPGVSSIDIGSTADVREVHRSIGSVPVAPPGYAAEACYAYICSLWGSRNYEVFAALHLTQSNQVLIYAPERQPADANGSAAVVESAVIFLESIGFMMDPLDLPAGKKEEILAQIPIFDANDQPLKPAEKRVEKPGIEPKPVVNGEPAPVSTPKPTVAGPTQVRPAEPEPGDTAFEYARSVNAVDLPDVMDVLEVHRSLSPSSVAPEGFPSQPCEAYVCGVKGSGAPAVFVALVLQMSAKTLVYLPKRRPSDPAGYRVVVGNAMLFLESIGFMMDQVSLPADRAKREAALKSISLFRFSPADSPTTARPLPPPAASVVSDAGRKQGPAPGKAAVPVAPAAPPVKEDRSPAAPVVSVSPPREESSGRGAPSVKEQLARILGSF